ncbi:MAG: Bug family tripartite tricarboxylate transporter substrate binding protein [Comamonas sp.]
MQTSKLDRRRLLAALGWLGAAPWTGAWAANSPGQRGKKWPAQSVNLIVPFPAGGTSAVLGKQLVQPFQHVTQQNLRLQYQGGAGGIQGASYAASMAADGQNLLIGGSYLAISRALAPDAEFDWMQDLRPLALIAHVPQVVLVNPARMRSRTAMEWLSDLGRKPARFRMATAGSGSSSHISSEILRHQENLQYETVHFRGSGPALHDLLSGSVDMMIDGLVSCLPHVRSGRLKALAVSGEQRIPVLPDVPSAKELGIHALDRVTWYGLFAPIGLPDRQAVAIVEVLKRLGDDPQLLANFEALGIQWGNLYGDGFTDMVKAETLSWAQRLKHMGATSLMQKTAEE